ncbi:RagB/SusD family nutrient uptake outer membrane protein [Lutibacter sp. A64]|uniref:RagB/SusD family nutrient uptake outer membrane protein n=1 Tax=Lutibacter sp. A64 TaxID=2918526 RepID=UPI001F0542AB|nr:RagB/SusD family nutrient uptake outer membrane protein [Lutibacter sp. A64]UMB54202.1 RagB/SusD family nutrient uptake outer membrane protein [Lutibacter sp. A64]
MGILIVIALISFYSCDDFVDVELPNSQLTAQGVYEEKTTANAAMTAIYSKIRDEGLLTGGSTGLSHLLGNYTDELDFYGSSQNETTAFYNNTLLVSNTDVRQLWNSSYNQIYAANAVFEGVENSIHLPVKDRNQLKGEALFVRALIHLYLANIFGDVPYITTTDYVKNKQAKRAPLNTIYERIKTDLADALLLLPEDDISYTRVRPNKYACYALLARVNLYAGYWEEAVNEASIVLNKTSTYVFEQDLDKVFLKESTATIWQLSPAFDSGNTLESETFNFTVGPPPLSALSTHFIDAFNAGDQRKTHWIKTVSDGTTNWMHPYKYKYSNTGSSVENSIVFRLGELYLIKAEVLAHLGELSSAKEALNQIRNRAGLNNTTAQTQDELLEAILQERRFELFTEFGHRFFDLKRFDKIQSVLSEVKPGWDANDILFPIPEIELNLNTNLTPQNPGY